MRLQNFFSWKMNSQNNHLVEQFFSHFEQRKKIGKMCMETITK